MAWTFAPDCAGSSIPGAANTHFGYQYDAWNRLVQVNRRGTVVLNQHGRPVEGGELGRWLVHYTYDGLGRMDRHQTPWDGPAAGRSQRRWAVSEPSVNTHVQPLQHPGGMRDGRQGEGGWLGTPGARLPLANIIIVPACPSGIGDDCSRLFTTPPPQSLCPIWPFGNLAL